MNRATKRKLMLSLDTGKAVILITPDSKGKLRLSIDGELVGIFKYYSLAAAAIQGLSTGGWEL